MRCSAGQSPPKGDDGVDLIALDTKTFNLKVQRIYNIYYLSITIKSKSNAVNQVLENGLCRNDESSLLILSCRLLRRILP